jgi:hypothetical protein
MKCSPNAPLLEAVRWLRSNAVDATGRAKQAVNRVDSIELLPQERLRAKAIWVTVLTQESALFRLIKLGCRNAVCSGVGSKYSIVFKLWIFGSFLTVLGAIFLPGIIKDWMDGAQIVRVFAALPISCSPILLASRSAMHLVFLLNPGARRFLTSAERREAVLCGGLATVGVILVALGLTEILIQSISVFPTYDEDSGKAVGVFQSIPVEIGNLMVRLAIPLSLCFMVETRPARIVHGFLATVGGLAALAWWSRTAWLQSLDTEHSTDVLRAIVALDLTSLMVSVLLARTFFGWPVQNPEVQQRETSDEKCALRKVSCNSGVATGE